MALLCITYCVIYSIRHNLWLIIFIHAYDLYYSTTKALEVPVKCRIEPKSDFEAPKCLIL